MSTLIIILTFYILLFQKSSDEELEVLSVLPEHSDTCVVVPSTLITFLGRIYKFVFCLDVSQSLASVVSYITLSLSNISNIFASDFPSGESGN